MMTDLKDMLAEHFYQRQIQLNPIFCSLVDSSDVTHKNTVKDFARLLIDNAEHKMAEFTALYCSAWSKGNNTVNEFTTHSFYAERQCFKDRMSIFSVKEDNLFTALTNPVPIGAHRLALRACHLDLVNINLRGTCLLDELVANHLMEDSDVRSIVAKAEDRAITETFLRRLSVMLSGQKFADSFIPIFSNYFPDEVSKLSAIMQQASALPDFSKCYNCQVKAHVEPRLLADVMYTNGIIDSNTHQDLREQTISNQEKWNKLTTEVKDHRDILETLRIRLPLLYEEFDLANAESFDCWCHKIITQPALPSADGESDGSVSDIANMADLKSELGYSDDDDDDDDDDESIDMSLTEDTCTSEDASDDFRTRSKENMMMPSRIKDIFSDTLDKTKKGIEVQEVCETKGVKLLREDTMKSETVIKSKSGETKKPQGNEGAPKRSFVTSVKSFLNRQLFSIRLLNPLLRRDVPTDHDEFTYDAFVVYADENTHFVLNDMLAKLENELEMRLCIHHRDFIPGDLIVSNIGNAMRTSRKTVAVLSPAMLRSIWCEYEVEMANCASMERGRNTLLFVMYEYVAVNEIPTNIKAFIRRAKYLDYATSKGDATFWDDLKRSIRD